MVLVVFNISEDIATYGIASNSDQTVHVYQAQKEERYRSHAPNQQLFKPQCNVICLITSN